MDKITRNLSASGIPLLNQRRVGTYTGGGHEQRRFKLPNIRITGFADLCEIFETSENTVAEKNALGNGKVCERIALKCEGPDM